MFSGAEAIHKRTTYSRKGLWRGYWRLGRCYHFVNYHPVSVLLSGLYFLSKPPSYHGVAFLLAYSVSFIQRNEQSSDPLFRDYYWKSFLRLRRRVRDRGVSILRRVAMRAGDASR
jgi:hypothetical protein